MKIGTARRAQPKRRAIKGTAGVDPCCFFGTLLWQEKSRSNWLEVAQIRRLSARNICSDYHGREETIGIAKGGEFIFDDLILCPQLPAKEKAAAQAGAPPIDSAPLAAVGEGRLLLRALHRHCQECVATSSSTTRSRVFRCRPRRTHRPALTEAA